MEKPAQHSAITRLVSPHDAAEIFGRSPATLKSWWHEGIGGPN